MLIRVETDGVSPPMLDAFPIVASLSGSKSTMGGQKPGPREEAEARLYVDPELEAPLYFPGPNLFSGLVAAGIFQEVGRRQLTTSKASILPGALSVVEMKLPIGPQDWEVDSRPIVNAAGSRTIVHRPRFDKWRLQFTLDIEADELDPAVVRRLVDDYGRKIGLGVFRPQRKGPFGRFVVVGWQEE